MSNQGQNDRNPKFLIPNRILLLKNIANGGNIIAATININCSCCEGVVFEGDC